MRPVKTVAYAEVLRSLVTGVLKTARREMNAAKIFDLLTRPLARSGYWSWNRMPTLGATERSKMEKKGEGFLEPRPAASVMLSRSRV